MKGGSLPVTDMSLGSIRWTSISCLMLTRSESVYACNFAICTNKDRLQRPDMTAPRNTTECEVYKACNEITRVKLGGAHDLNLRTVLERLH